ncbi:uncharacterized protein LOC135685877 [Rhopilema esculentum]|uniref:uncharacterized protein LOC135685877 n=1 Tax=Rhopilema esculentum TaxID=499914 RepID=UPI0031D0784A
MGDSEPSTPLGKVSKETDAMSRQESMDKFNALENTIRQMFGMIRDMANNQQQVSASGNSAGLSQSVSGFLSGCPNCGYKFHRNPRGSPSASAVSTLDESWQTLLAQSLSVNTRKTYSSAQKQFITFCQQNEFLHDNGSPCPASGLTLLRFIGKAGKTCQASTLKVYLAAVRALHIAEGYPDPLQNLHRIPLVVRGLRRVKSSNAAATKLPITALILHTIKVQLDLTKFDDAMLWAACCTAFFGFLRAAEFTVPSNHFSEGLHLSLDKISVDKMPVPSVVSIALSRSKTDQFGKGCSILLARSDSVLCPVTAFMTYIRLRGERSGPLFLFSNGAFLTKNRLNSWLQKSLLSAGWNGRFTLHSFRVGAASTAASLGFPEYLIKALGRWSSEAYQVYIKLSQTRLITASRCLASASTLSSG